MSLYVIADLHLPLGIDKPMDIFGSGWSNYVERLHDNWQSVVKKDDTVIIPGDISWATYLEQGYKDFEYLNSLNGKKVLLKGNHDYWWTTMNKLRVFIEENKFDTIEFIQNNTKIYKNIAVCGTRGWINPSWDGFDAEDRKIFNREVLRLEMSLKSAECNPEVTEKYVFLHYPPTSFNFENNDMLEMIKSHNVTKVFYGHLHGMAHKNAIRGEFNGIEYMLVSADYLQFMPKKIAD